MRVHRRVGNEGPTVLVAHPGAEMYGSDRVLLESVSAFVGAGWHVVTTVPQPGPLVRELELRGSRVVIATTPVLRKSALRPTGMARLCYQACVGTVRGLRLLRDVRPSLVYVSTVTIPLWSALARATRRPVLVHVHEADATARPVVRKVLAMPLLAATRIVTNSRFSRDTIRESVPSLGPRSSVLYNGVTGPDVVVHPRPEIDGPIKLLYVGRLSPRKGVDVAIEAVRLLESAGCTAVLDIVGAVFPGYEWYEAELRATARAAGLEDRIRFHGFQPDVWSFLAGADVALVPSQIDESFGNTVVEALLAARPVVVSATSGLLEAAGGYATAQFVPTGDPQALADAVLRVRDQWAEMSALALDDAALAESRNSPTLYRRGLLAVVDLMAVVHR
jgi:glycosyltransferase involved in cell wall biosynthesis